MDLEGTREQRRGRRTFEKDFKLGAVKMVLEGGKSVLFIIKLEQIYKCTKINI